MQEGLSTRARIAILIYSMTNAVLFGIGIVTVLNVPSLAAHLWIGIPVVVGLSLLLAVPIAWFIAPRLRARYWRRREEAEITRDVAGAERAGLPRTSVRQRMEGNSATGIGTFGARSTAARLSSLPRSIIQ